MTKALVTSLSVIHQAGETGVEGGTTIEEEEESVTPAVAAVDQVERPPMPQLGGTHNS